MDISEIIASITVCVLLVLCLVFLFIYAVNYDKQRKEFIDTLDEHDKAVILDYESSLRVLKFKKKK